MNGKDAGRLLSHHALPGLVASPHDAHTLLRYAQAAATQVIVFHLTLP